jgi:hypothetical protein
MGYRPAEWVLDRLLGKRHYSMIQAAIHLQFSADRTIEHLAEQCDLRLSNTANSY